MSKDENMTLERAVIEAQKCLDVFSTSSVPVPRKVLARLLDMLKTNQSQIPALWCETRRKYTFNVEVVRRLTIEVEADSLKQAQETARDECAQLGDIVEWVATEA